MNEMQPQRHEDKRRCDRPAYLRVGRKNQIATFAKCRLRKRFLGVLVVCRSVGLIYGLQTTVTLNGSVFDCAHKERKSPYA